MQLGYSLNLGETVPAGNADYDDCAKFQITCPACREAVFKGLRNTPREIHYFSHYRAHDDSLLCEMRVAQIAKNAGMSDGFIGHDQTLRRFLATFRDSIITAYEGSVGINLRRPTMKIYTQPYLDDISEGVFKKVYSSVWTSKDSRATVISALNSSALLQNKSQFWKRRGAAYIMDALRHLETEQASTNRRFLVAMAFAAWPRRSDYFMIIDNHDIYNEFIQSISDAESASTVHRKANAALMNDRSYISGKADGEKAVLAEMARLSPNETVSQLRKIQAEAQQILRKKKNEITVLAATIELVVPMLTLLALGCE